MDHDDIEPMHEQVLDALATWATGNRQQAIVEFRAAIRNDTRSELYMACVMLARFVGKVERRFDTRLGPPWTLRYSMNSLQGGPHGWVDKFCVAVAKEDHAQSGTLFDSMSSPEEALENVGALFHRAGELLKRAYEERT